jgi:hypothetical protein
MANPALQRTRSPSAREKRGEEAGCFNVGFYLLIPWSEACRAKPASAVSRLAQRLGHDKRLPATAKKISSLLNPLICQH